VKHGEAPEISPEIFGGISDSRSRRIRTANEILGSTTPDRGLAAILAADVVGYSHLLREDVAAVIRAVRAYRETVRPVTHRRGTREWRVSPPKATVWARSAGPGFLRRTRYVSVDPRLNADQDTA
jgi:class 3 adenylate cyclase